MRCLTMFTLMAVSGLLAAAPGPKDPPKVDDPLIGTWELDQMTVGGKDIDFDKIFVTYTADGKCETGRVGGPVNLSWPYRHEPTKKPAELDVIQPGFVPERVGRSIYKVDGDTLTVCGDYNSADRPTTFDSPANTGRSLLVLKRVKPKD